MASPLNWIDALFFGYRRILDALGAELPERAALQLTGSAIASVTDDPTNKRTVVQIDASEGIAPDGVGGYAVGTPSGGWVSVKSDNNGFRVYDDDEGGFAFVVDNSGAITRTQWILEARMGAILRDTSAPGAAPVGGGLQLTSVSGALRLKQTSPPTISGTRNANPAVASMLSTLAAMGLLVDATTAGDAGGTSLAAVVLSSDISSSSTVYSGAVLLQATFTVPSSGKVQVAFSASVSCQSAAGGVQLQAWLDGVALANTIAHGLRIYSPAAASAQGGSFNFMLTGLTPGTSHTVELHWKAPASNPIQCRGSGSQPEGAALIVNGVN